MANKAGKSSNTMAVNSRLGVLLLLGISGLLCFVLYELASSGNRVREMREATQAAEQKIPILLSQLLEEVRLMRIAIEKHV